MSDDVPVNDPAYTVATDAVIQSIFDFMEQSDPKTRDKVADLLKRRFDGITIDNDQQAGFMQRVRKAAEQITRRPMS